MSQIVTYLLESDEPSVRCQVLTKILGKVSSLDEARRLQRAIPGLPSAVSLLAVR